VNKKGEVSIGDLTGLVALLLVITVIVITQLQFRGWEKVTKELKIEQKYIFTAVSTLSDITTGLREADVYSAFEFKQLKNQLDKHEASIHYGRPTRQEKDAQRAARKALAK